MDSVVLIVDHIAMALVPQFRLKDDTRERMLGTPYAGALRSSGAEGSAA